MQLLTSTAKFKRGRSDTPENDGSTAETAITETRAIKIQKEKQPSIGLADVVTTSAT
jgi:hypothetical protein